MRRVQGTAGRIADNHLNSQAFCSTCVSQHAVQWFHPSHEFARPSSDIDGCYEIAVSPEGCEAAWQLVWIPGNGKARRLCVSLTGPAILVVDKGGIKVFGIIIANGKHVPVEAVAHYPSAARRVVLSAQQKRDWMRS